MPERVQAIRGMNDILPDKTPLWRYVERVFENCLHAYGYQEIRFPLLENTQLFKRTIGEVTDIVEKEMYTFADLNGESISLRPEGTASCLRACLENNLLYNQNQKLWYMGPMFRHERPQKGRYRQFTQLGVEAIGIPGYHIELELIALCRRLWSELGFKNSFQLQVNTIGDLSERKVYKTKLVEYLKDFFHELDEDSQKRLERNPLRILDSKNPDMQRIINNAPKLIDSLSEKSTNHFNSFCDGLKALHIPFEINPFLVRGLDYYGHTVFEWVSDQLGSQATVCAGGRYDILIEQLGGTPTPAVGFALGIERLILLLEQLDSPINPSEKACLFIITQDATSMLRAIEIAELVHNNFPNLQVLCNSIESSFKSQFKKADKSGARFALILGESEMKDNKVAIKDLREEKEQVCIDQNLLMEFLEKSL